MLRKATRLANPWLPVLAAFTVGAAAGLAWNLKEYDAWPDLFPMLPFAAVGLGGVFPVATKRLPVRAALAVAVALSLVATVAGHPPLGDQPRRPPRGPARIGEGGARAAARRRHDHLGRGAAGRSSWTSGRNPTRHQMFSAGLQFYIDDIWPGGLDGFRRDLVEDRARHDRRSATRSPTGGERRSSRSTSTSAAAPDWFWYARRSLGEEKLAELRKAAGYDPDDEWARPPPPEPLLE